MFTSIIVQEPDGHGGWTSHAANVRGVAAAEVRIVVAAGQAGAAGGDGAALVAGEIRNQLNNLGLGPLQALPSVGQSDFVRQLLVLVGDGDSALTLPAGLEHWTDDILPVLPVSSEPEAGWLLAGITEMPLAIFYAASPAECVPAALRAARVLDDLPRVFISYKRTDADGLATQLFEALVKEGFDVFLDRCSLAPAQVLSRRIGAQLADKGMVLVLATPRYLDSDWCREELSQAASLGLGIQVLAVPGAPALPSPVDASRRELANTDFVGDAPGRNVELKMKALKDVTREFRREYDRALLHRQQRLFFSTRVALLHAGCASVVASARGCLEVEINRPDFPVGGAHYNLALTHRSPDVNDFHRAALPRDCQANPPAQFPRPLVIGLKSSMESHAARRLGWLERKTQVRALDQALSAPDASEIARGNF